MFSGIDRKRIFAFAVLTCRIATAADEGWTGCNPNRVMPTPEKEIWRAPFNNGMDAFRVDWRDWGVEDADAADRKWARERKAPLEPPDRSGTMIDEALFDAGIAADTEHSARCVRSRST